MDEDGDGLYDFLELTISVAGILNTETINNVKVLLLFNNTLTVSAVTTSSVIFLGRFSIGVF